MVCHTTHETSCWSSLVVKNEETSVPVCSVVWEELCKAAAASEGYSLQQVRNSLTCDFSFLLTWTTLKSNNPSAM